MTVPEDRVPLLAVRDLAVGFGGSASDAVVHGLSYELRAGETLGIVGESGSGKSVSSLALLGLLPPGGRVTQGQAQFDGVDLVRLAPREMRRIRGGRIAMVFQDALASLNPYLTIGSQMMEPFQLHRGFGRKEAWKGSVELLGQCGIDDPDARMRQYPHEFSGGMRQRVMIAMALAGEPALLIADEPTSALDVTVQAQVLALLAREQAARGFAMLFISHDLAVVRRVADRVLVMQRGRVVETGETGRILRQPDHAYTRRLIDAIPTGAKPESLRGRPEDTRPLLSATGITVGFDRRGEVIRAVNDVSLTVRPGEVLGIVGESGSGKSTLMRALLRVQRLDAGEVQLGDTSLHRLGGSALRAQRRRIQMVFQDPYASLDPRMTIHDALAGVIRLHDRKRSREAVTERVLALLDDVGIAPEQANLFPHEFSGGQRQRIAIARALAADPELLVADEPVSALDVTVQANILSLLQRLVEERGVGLVIVSHDLAVVRLIADRVMVMLDGRVVESGPTERIFQNPSADYTRTLMAARP